MPQAYELGCIGGGNMAEGIVAAAVGRGLYSAQAIVVAEPVADRRRFLAEQFKIAVTGDNRVATQAPRILLAVKPQTFSEVAAELAGAIRHDQLLISIMAGFSTQKIAQSFPDANPRVVRVMPNLPIRVGAGIAGVFAGANTTAQDLAETRALFDAGGSTVVVQEEGLLDAVTAIAGSGPAYFYYFVEAMVAGGVACGLSEADALKLVEHTCLGAARMMIETEEAPAELRRKVTSKAGTTHAAIEHMKAQAVDSAICEAARKAFERARELGS